jgi:hypothetical protein
MQGKPAIPPRLEPRTSSSVVENEAFAESYFSAVVPEGKGYRTRHFVEK